ncbi:hypothetical protein [Acinetobacter lwoffii]|uniref:hypothetical protein n=1 Tax=Acinetobacter lwoffii TaxID=28090 RepID=UPI00209ABC11|nr:hypothetical protein [Acinetobacter lwoffii]MCO8061734.1 hypothetical protein [Acinetobacter lwoffii]
MEVVAQTLEVGRNLHILKVNAYDDKLIELINKYLVKVCEGEDEDSADIQRVKKRLFKFISTKHENTQMGAIAEFFIHLYLNDCNYKQEFLFFNLEETSIKKGFDGLYTKEDEIYVIESKSGKEDTEDISHLGKIKEAYNDLKKYFNGTSDKGNNNPWRNAYNHASHNDIKAKDSLKKQIKTLANLYDEEIYGDIKDYNIVPCSTIFLDSEWKEGYIDDFLDSVDKLNFLIAKNSDVIILTKLKLSNFMDFLGLENNND